MRIGIDIRPLHTMSGKRGVGTYVCSLVNSLFNIDSKNEYFLFASSESVPEELSEKAKGRIVRLRRSERGTTFWDQIFWHGILKRLDIDIFHSTFYASPVFVPEKVSIVQTVHDLIPLIFRGSASFKNTMIFRINFSLLRNVDRIIAVSENTKNDIVRILKIREKRISIVYNGADHLVPSSCKKPSVDSEAIREARPYLFYSGGFDPMKNIARLIEAFGTISTRNSDLKLFIAGAGFQGAVKSDKVVFTGYLGVDDLISYYKNAEVFIFPSLYEGFGFPPLEAMSLGTPVIASRGGSLQEILGEAAFYVNSENASEIAHTIEEVMKNKELRAWLVSAGLKRASQFVWDNCAQQTLAVYEDLYRKVV